MEKGHFESLEAVLSVLKRPKHHKTGDGDEPGRPVPSSILEDPSLLIPSDGRSQRRQTFLFSATLGDTSKSSAALVGGIAKAAKHSKVSNTVSAVVALMKQVGQGGKPAVLNLSAATQELLLARESGVGGAGKPSPAPKSTHKLPSGLRLSTMSCMKDEKVRVLSIFPPLLKCF